MGIFGQKGQFWTVFGQNGQNGNFFKKALGTFSSRLQALTAKFQKKVMNSFRETALHTYGRTEATPKVSSGQTSFFGG